MPEHQASIAEVATLSSEASAVVISNFAWQHMKAATIFRNHVKAIEESNTNNPLGSFFEDIRSYSSGCIMSASASLEALINELFINPEGVLRKRLINFEEKFWGHGGIEWKTPLEKYQIALDMLNQERLIEHEQPFRDAWALLELRNALIHYKPTWDPDRQRKVKMIEVLSGKYDTSPFITPGSDFVTMQSMSSGCMDWVVTTAITFMREFHNRTALDEHKMGAFFRLID